jgi:hypothetical protein
LFIRLDTFDTISALPALHLVARAFPNAELMVQTSWPTRGGHCKTEFEGEDK